MRFFSFLSSFLSAWRDYPAEINTVLGDRYVNMQLLGEGSYGMTYKCLDQKSGAVVALKQSRPSKGEYAQYLLRRERNILQALRHSQIPEPLDFFVEGKHTYLVMTYVEGDTLEDLIFEQGCTYDEVSCIEMTLKLLDVVQYIHKKGYVHLDLRIPNVLFREERLSLIDFGLARQIGEAPRRQGGQRLLTRGRKPAVPMQHSSSWLRSNLILPILVILCCSCCIRPMSLRMAQILSGAGRRSCQFRPSYRRSLSGCSS